MEDHVIIDHEIRTLKTGLSDMGKDVERIDGESSEQSDRISALEYWRNGNGARGAEARLQEVEHGMVLLKECFGASQTDEAIERIASAAARSIVKNARDRDKTVVEKIKAVAAILSPLCAAAAVIIAAIVASS